VSGLSGGRCVARSRRSQAQPQGTADIRELKLRDWEPRPMIARQVTKIAITEEASLTRDYRAEKA